MSITANGDDDGSVARQELRRVLDDLTTRANKGEPGALASLPDFWMSIPKSMKRLAILPSTPNEHGSIFSWGRMFWRMNLRKSNSRT